MAHVGSENTDGVWVVRGSHHESGGQCCRQDDNGFPKSWARRMVWPEKNVTLLSCEGTGIRAETSVMSRD